MSGTKELNVIIKALDETLPGFKSARHGVQEFASEAKGLIAEAFAGFTIFEFFKGAIEKATEAEQSYAQLSNTLANVGVSYEQNRGQIDETIKSLQKVANVRTDDAIKGFNTLVQRSGDYNGSLKEMTLVADLAKAKHLEFNDAAELVGRVMGGNTRVLKQFGIVTKDSTEGLKELHERIGGAAATDMATFGGQVEATKVRFNNLLESVGDVITGSTTLGGTMSDLRGGIEKLTNWVETNSGMLVKWFGIIVAGVELVGTNIKAVISTAYSLGKILGDVLSLSWGAPGDAEKRKALFADMADQQKSMIKANNDAGNSFGKFADDVTLATARAEAVQTESAARLRANAARNASELAARRAAEDEKRAAEAKKKQDAEDKAITQRLQLATKLAESATTQSIGLAQLTLIEHAAMAALKDGNLTWERRAVLLERVNAAHAARLKFHDPDVEPTALDRMAGANADEIAREQKTVPTKNTLDEQNRAGIDKSTRAGAFSVDLSLLPQIGFMDTLGKKWDDHRKKVLETGEAYKSFGQSLADIVAGPIAQFGESTAMAMGALVVGSKTAGAAFKSAMLNAIATVAKEEGDYFVGKAIAATGDAILGNPFAIFANSQYLLAAGAMYAVSGGASALASSGGGGGGGGGSYGSGVGSYNDSMGVSGSGKVTVVWPGTNRSILNMGNPDDQQAVIDMLRKLVGNRDLDFLFAGG